MCVNCSASAPPKEMERRRDGEIEGRRPDDRSEKGQPLCDSGFLYRLFLDQIHSPSLNVLPEGVSASMDLLGQTILPYCQTRRSIANKMLAGIATTG